MCGCVVGGGVRAGGGGVGVRGWVGGGEVTGRGGRLWGSWSKDLEGDNI